MPIIGILLALVLAGGVSVAAENSLPGQTLYGVKVGVNEEVRAVLALSAGAKANWTIRRAERRLEESETLIVMSALSADTRALVEHHFETHAERVSARVAEFEAKDDLSLAADVISNFETSLTAHERILASLSAREIDAAVRTESEWLASEVKAEKEKAAQRRLEIETKLAAMGGPEVQAAAEGRLTAAENKIREVQAFIDRAEARLGTVATAEAEARLQAAESTLVEGRARLSAGAYGEAFTLFSQAHRTAQEAKLLTESTLRLNVDVGLGASAGFQTEQPEEAPTEPPPQEMPELNVNGSVNANVNGSVNVNRPPNSNVNVAPSPY